MNRWLFRFAVMWLVTSVVFVHAQETCPAIVQEALANIETVCSSLERNEACYGHQNLQADLSADVQFSAVGDITGLENIRTLTLSGMNVDTGSWGVSMLSLQANLPDTLPGQNVTFLLFGDTSIENANYEDPAVAAEQAELSEDSIAPGITRSGLVDDATPRVTYTFEAEAGDVVTITLRSPDGSLDPYLILQDSSGQVLAENDDFDSLDSAIADFAIPATGTYTIVATRFGFEDGFSTGSFDLELSTGDLGYTAPMQAFYLTTGIGDAACEEAPDSGLLVQSPDGGGEVRFLANEVQIDMGSTLFMQAQPNNEMIVQVLEGRARVEAFGVARFVPAGALVRIPLDDRPAAAGPPSEVEAYSVEAIASVPGQALPETVSAAEPASDEAIGAGGEVVVTLTWDNDADMDLYLTEPNGNTIYFGSPSSFSGAQLSQDANAACATRDESIEVITWPTGQPRLGQYTVLVSEYEICNEGSASWDLTVTIGGTTVIEESGTGEASFTFQR